MFFKSFFDVIQELNSIHDVEYYFSIEYDFMSHILDKIVSKKKVNKHGLSRYIPQNVRQKIRKESGYGCIICGSMFCDYEHIEPEFNDAKSHDSACMALLCGGCHHHVTGKRKSKNRVWKAKAEPFALKNGYIKELLEPALDETIKIGNSVISSTQVAIAIHGKPILWFEKSNQSDEPILVNAIFHDSNGESVAFINRNQFISTVGEFDIKSEGTTIEFRPLPKKISLILDIEGDKPISVNRLNMSYLDTKIQITRDGSMLLNVGESNFSINQMMTNNCGAGIVLGSIPKTRKMSLGIVKKITIAYNIARSENKFVNCNGDHIGWVSSGFLVDKQYDFVGILDKDDQDKIIARSVTSEFIGYLYQDVHGYFSVEMNIHEYESYEPIWTSHQSKQSMNIRIRPEIDVSHRFFGMSFRPILKQSINNHDSLQALMDDNKVKQYASIDTPIELKDRVIIDFIGYVDRNPFDGGQANSFVLDVGSQRMIPGFEEGLIGHKKSEEFELDVIFPNAYHAKNLSGKAVTFKVKILDVERLVA